MSPALSNVRRHDGGAGRRWRSGILQPMRSRKQLAIAVLCGVLVACASPSATLPAFPAVLNYDSRGAPRTILEIGTIEVAHVGCNDGGVVTPGKLGVPPLPWDLRLVGEDDGRLLFSSRVTELPQWLVLIGDSPMISSTPVAGPAGPPCPSG